MWIENIILGAVAIGGFGWLLAAFCLVAGRFGHDRYTFLWWFWRLGLLPMISAGFAVYIYLVPRSVPVDYDPTIHGNPGRLDFLAMLFYGIGVPIAYTILILPFLIAWVWQKSK